MTPELQAMKQGNFSSFRQNSIGGRLRNIAYSLNLSPKFQTFSKVCNATLAGDTQAAKDTGPMNNPRQSVVGGKQSLAHVAWTPKHVFDWWSPTFFLVGNTNWKLVETLAGRSAKFRGCNSCVFLVFPASLGPNHASSWLETLIWTKSRETRTHNVVGTLLLVDSWLQGFFRRHEKHSVLRLLLRNNFQLIC